MTALDEYARLEAVAQYVDGRTATGHEVVLTFGERILVISDLTDRVLAHWPLASLKAIDTEDPGTIRLVPDLESAEGILLADPAMISAISQVCPELRDQPASPARPRRMGRWILAGTVVALVAGGFALLPHVVDRMVDHISQEQAAVVGATISAQIGPALADAGGPSPRPCRAPDGIAAVNRLIARLDTGGTLPRPLSVTVLDHPRADALALPGGRIILLRGLLDQARSPETIAAVLAHQIGHIRSRDPLRKVVASAGLTETAGLLLGDFLGKSDEIKATEAIVSTRHTTPQEAAADAVAYELLAAAGLPTAPYARFIDQLAGSSPPDFLSRHPDPSARQADALSADTVGDQPFDPALGDRDWIALQNICED